MKEISVDDAQSQLDAVCDRALAGEVIRLRNRAGALVELTPVPMGPRPARLEAQPLTEGDEDAEWAAFENHCARASD
jgi:antitoxin (DNA-binding transcriptional repressor) of toxin-antitoxin stability system